MGLFVRVNARLDTFRELRKQGYSFADARTATSLVSDDIVDQVVQAQPPEAVKSLGDGKILSAAKAFWQAHKAEIVKGIISLVIGALLADDDPTNDPKPVEGAKATLAQPSPAAKPS